MVPEETPEVSDSAPPLPFSSFLFSPKIPHDIAAPQMSSLSPHTFFFYPNKVPAALVLLCLSLSSLFKFFQFPSPFYIFSSPVLVVMPFY